MKQDNKKKLFHLLLFCILFGHKMSKQTFKCRFCKKGFEFAYNLKSHLKRHPSIYKYECLFCSRQCLNKSCLFDHYRTHTKERPYFCNICDISLSKALSMHMIMHTGERPFQCKVCKKSFTQKSNMR